MSSHWLYEDNFVEDVAQKCHYLSAFTRVLSRVSCRGGGAAVFRKSGNRFM